MSVKLLRAASLVAFLSIGGATGGAAQSLTEADYAKVNTALMDGVVLPLYVGFSHAATGFSNEVKTFCSAPAPRDLKDVKAGYQHLADSWMALEPVRMGPVEHETRAFRIHFWPDRRGRGARQLAAMLRAKDPALLSPKAIAGSSVAVQGLPAVETILFDDGNVRDLTEASDDYTCRVLAAIAGNLADMGGAMSDEWASFRKEIDRAGQSDDAHYESQKQVTGMVVKSIYVTLKHMVEVKMDPVLGANVNKNKPKHAESFLAGRSIRNLEQNLTTLRALFGGEGSLALSHLMADDQAEVKTDISIGFARALDIARGIGLPLSAAVGDRKERPAVVRLASQVEALEELVAKRLAPAIGVDLGFNALDGD